MAFDMCCGEINEKIDHHEEGLFVLVNEDDGVQFPTLYWLWREFYDGPVISPENSNRLVHELILFRALNKDLERSYHVLIERLLVFFSGAYVTSKSIKCISD
jgi:hypothetical protein